MMLACERIKYISSHLGLSNSDLSVVCDCKVKIKAEIALVPFPENPFILMSLICISDTLQLALDVTTKPNPRGPSSLGVQLTTARGITFLLVMGSFSWVERQIPPVIQPDGVGSWGPFQGRKGVGGGGGGKGHSPGLLRVLRWWGNDPDTGPWCGCLGAGPLLWSHHWILQREWTSWVGCFLMPK